MEKIDRVGKWGKLFEEANFVGMELQINSKSCK